MRSTTRVAAARRDPPAPACGSAQVGRHQRRAGHVSDAAHDRGIAFELDVGAEALQFERVHEAVLEHGLGDDADAFGDAVERGELRLHVGRERGIRRGA